MSVTYIKTALKMSGCKSIRNLLKQSTKKKKLQQIANDHIFSSENFNWTREILASKGMDRQNSQSDDATQTNSASASKGMGYNNSN